MDAQWIKSPTGRRVLEHWADARPAWVWTGDGQTLVWRNPAARLFHGRVKGKDKRGSADTVPLRGLISRAIRLGSLNRSSLSRMQFLVGERPVSATCACTPLTLADGQAGLLVVGVDPVQIDLRGGKPRRDAWLEALLPTGSSHLQIDGQDQVIGGSEGMIERFGPLIESGGSPDVDALGHGQFEIDGASLPFTRLKAGPNGTSLLLFEAATAEREAATIAAAETSAEPLLPMGLPPVEARSKPDPEEEDHWIEPLGEPASARGLTSLFDRLADDSALFEPLRADEDFAGPAPAATTTPQPAVEARDADPQLDVEGAAEPRSAEDADALSDAPAAPESTPPTPLYRVVGRGITPLAVAGTERGAASDVPHPEDPAFGENQSEPAALPSPDIALPPALSGDSQPALDAGADGTADSLPAQGEDGVMEPGEAHDPESVERVSRYNFDELARILNDRVGNGETAGPGAGPGPARLPPRQPLPSVPSATPEGALVTLGGETLVLNRLPLGILVFRDQQVLFANRAITEMIGYESVEGLRAAGLGAIFPAAGDEAQQAGPVNHLVQRNGTLVPVTARLQSVSWQGKPALMLSASTTEVRTGHEAAVRAFAELAAAARGEGFIETTRAGLVTMASGDARLVLGQDEEQLLGRPVSALAAPGTLPALREFLERPARFAETSRPSITVGGVEPGVELMLFAQGQAGIVSGYFGFVRRVSGASLPALSAPMADDPGLLARLSRGVRRPLNTVIGFSDLIGSAAFGAIENERYLEYARDIQTAGLEIAALVDELDDFSRLRDGRYAPRATDIDLAGLLESSITRVRGQANAARVLVRSAISERLPRIRADRASLAQAMLNLLASAIDQTPPGGSVVLSAQVDDFGGVVVNVRDSAHDLTDLGERFVVFRDGIGRNGEALGPVRSSVGLALTRALLAVNAMTLTVDPAASTGTLFSVTVPPENIVLAASLPAAT